MTESAMIPCVAIYARVSTTGPKGQDIQAQLARLRGQLRSAGFPGVEQTIEYVDDGVSGSADTRPAFDRLREQIRAGEINTVVAAKLDRLGRSAKSVLEFFDLCERHSVRVVLTDQAVDTGTPAGRLVRTLLAGVAEFEADLIRERTAQAMAAFKAGTRTTRSGRPVGRPRVLTDEKVARIRELRFGQGRPWKEVAQYVGIREVTCRKVRKAPQSSTPSVLNK